MLRPSLACALFVIGCSSSDANEPRPIVTSDASVEEAPPTCATVTCSAPGSVCRDGACVDDCRGQGAVACAAGTACDYTDGKCRAESAACFLPAVFEPCPSPAQPNRKCGPGTMCDDNGVCRRTSGTGCTGETCEADGRCFATGCPCDRPTAFCTPPSLENMNKAEFVGSPVNGRDEEGAFALDFDDVCTAYTVTMISGPDYLRQMLPDGTLSSWTSTTNLNMGEVAVLRVPSSEFETLGDVAATYICCATCGCVETGEDGRIGVVRLDRKNDKRPLPNVLPAKATVGTGPFGSTGLDTGPYALTWGADKALYAGNVETNGDFARVDLESKAVTSVTTFLARVTASTVFDLRRLLVATEGGQVYLVETKTGGRVEFAKLPGHVTSIRRDNFTGRVYAEVATTPPAILEISADGKSVTPFQTPPRLGRIAIAPDGHLYHLSVFPKVFWKAGDSIVRWPLPAKR